VEISVEDIAHSLARQCRFNGHCDGFYSVAEHCLEVSRQVPEKFALWGLLHDAAEPYLSDQVRPVKGSCYYYRRQADRLESYRECEERILRCVADRFCLDFPVPKEVGEADDRMLSTERQQLFDDRQPHWGALNGIEPYPIVLRCMEYGLAEKMFLRRFKELTTNG
jgi:hypothetical protein